MCDVASCVGAVSTFMPDGWLRGGNVALFSHMQLLLPGAGSPTADVISSDPYRRKETLTITSHHPRLNSERQEAGHFQANWINDRNKKSSRFTTGYLLKGLFVFQRLYVGVKPRLRNLGHQPPLQSCGMFNDRVSLKPPVPGYPNDTALNP